MIDPLAEVVLLLQPGAPFSKVVSAAGRWRVRRSEYGRPFYCVLLEGSCCLAVDGAEPMTLAPSDFVLIPSADSFTMSSLEPPASEDAPVLLADGEFRLGFQSGAPEMRALIGYCEFGSPDSALLVSLLPRIVHVCGEKRLATLVQLVGEESRSQRPARDVVLARLLEVLLIEALRSTAGNPESSGLVRGLTDDRLATAIRQMHENPARRWTVAQLAKEAALSRSAFFERFNRAVGVAPMEYLLAWRMALAKKLLRQNQSAVADVSERVGYSSASTFSVAFTRYVGLSPARYAREASQRA
jgi:AraC-like DNA-binding protein